MASSVNQGRASGSPAGRRPRVRSSSPPSMQCAPGAGLVVERSLFMIAEVGELGSGPMFFLASAGSRRYRRKHAVVEPPATHAPPWAIPSATASAPGRGTNAPSRGADETDRRAEPPRRRAEPPVVRAGRHHHPWRRMAVLATAAAATAGARRQGQRSRRRYSDHHAAATAGARRQGQRWHSSQRSRRRYSDHHAAASRGPRRPPQPGNAHGEICRRRRRRSVHQRLIIGGYVNKRTRPNPGVPARPRRAAERVISPPSLVARQPSMCSVPSPSTRHSSLPCGSGRQVVRFWAESRDNGRARA